ncbi:MAG TPA: hypothetical protein PLU53_01775 [Bacteroidia bacterium]|nr:hypothetical protein [Bacteroidia bacterium]
MDHPGNLAACHKVGKILVCPALRYSPQDNTGLQGFDESIYVMNTEADERKREMSWKKNSFSGIPPFHCSGT